MIKWTPIGLAAVATCLVASGAVAHVLDAKADKAPYKLRTDVAKQLAKHHACLAKAVAKCESVGVLSTPECDPVSGVVSYEPMPGKHTEKFQGALAKCDSKLVLTKKGNDYSGIGCPGDCDAIQAGVQPCADLDAYAALVSASMREQLADLMSAIHLGCASAGSPSSIERNRCVKDAVKQATKYGASVLKCQQACELDAKGTKGGGATTNADVCSVESGAAPVIACADKAASRVTHAAAVAQRAAIAAFFHQITTDLFNRADATDPGAPAGTQSPCGTCGNGVREGVEMCDGAALGSCAACGTDCACRVDPVLDGAPGTYCTTTFNPSTADYQLLCVPSAGSGRHIRIEGMQSLANNGYVYLTMGFPMTPAGNPATAVGDGQFIFTGGKSVSCTNGWSYFRYSGITDPPTGSLCAAPIFGDYNLGPQEVCLDVSAATPPRVTFWATGANGVNCKDKSTLTAATALYTKDDWASANNQPVNLTTHFVKLSNASWATVSSAAVSSTTVLP